MRGASDGEIAVAHTFAMNSRRFMSISLSGREATPMDPSRSRTAKVGGVPSKSLKRELLCAFLRSPRYRDSLQRLVDNLYRRFKLPPVLSERFHQSVPLLGAQLFQFQVSQGISKHRLLLSLSRCRAVTDEGNRQSD